MTRTPTDTANRTRERNAAAMARLEELLRDPGPGITVRRVGVSAPADAVAEPPPPSAPAVVVAAEPVRAPSILETPVAAAVPDEERAPASSPAPAGSRSSTPNRVPMRANPLAERLAQTKPPAAQSPVSPAPSPPAVAALAMAPPQPAPIVLRTTAGAVETAAVATSASQRVASASAQIVPAPGLTSQERLRQRMQRAAIVVPGPAPVATPIAAAAPAPAKTPAPPATAAPTPVAPPPAAAVEPRPVVAPSRAAPATADDHLKHMPAGVRGKLASFLEGKTEAAPARERPSISPAASSALQSPMGMPGDGELWTALRASRKPFMAAGLFSFVINILMLAGPLFMLQVYDRVLSSGSIPTLVALAVLTSAIYGIIGLLELARTRIIVRMGTEIEQRISDRIFRASLRKTLNSPSTSFPALRELDNVRQFAGSQGPLTFFDAPWTPIYLGVIGLVHWMLGVTAVLGALSLLLVTWASERRSRGPLSEASKASAVSMELAETGQRNAESITAMGMISAYRDRWQAANWESLSWQMRAADRLGSMSSFSKALRLFLQSLMLAIGAGLAVKGEISAGSIIAGTIIFGRALAPIEQAIGHWKGYLKARESYAKLDKLLRSEPEPPQRLALPDPEGHLEVDSLRVAAPDTRHLILSNVNFYVKPGQMLAVIGPSASGKSTLARTLVGLWQPVSGSIHLDGARLDQWDPEALGAHIGFLPQNVELFAGSVRDNIARFRADATDDEIVEAARSAHAHELILALPQGYETPLGAFGTYLSSGQRQRIALARALFRHPALVVLDEPNSNLDRAGDEALASAIDGMRARGQAVVLVSHRVQAIGKADLLLYLDSGAQRAFGPRREVMQMFQSGLDNREPGTAAKAGSA